jgi:hypothetical protein
MRILFVVIFFMISSMSIANEVRENISAPVLVNGAKLESMEMKYPVKLPDEFKKNNKTDNKKGE